MIYYEPEYDKYRNVEMWFKCPICNKSFEVDEPDNYCEHYTEEATEKEKESFPCNECGCEYGDGSCSDCLEIQRAEGRYEELWEDEENKNDKETT